MNDVSWIGIGIVIGQIVFLTLIKLGWFDHIINWLNKKGD
jgi:hypothetical protein